MAKRKLMGAAALTAAIAGGGALGMALGTPVISGAQTEDPTTTTAAPEEPTTTTEAPDTTAPDTTTPDSTTPEDCGPGGGRGGFGHFGRIDLAVAADALGMTEDELRTALTADEETSIADVATAQGVDVQTVIDALVADATADIDEKLAAGDIDQARADELKADLTERVTEAVNRDGLGARGGPGGERGGFGHFGRIDLAVAADALGMTEDELRTALTADEETSIADIATAQGVDVQTVIDALVADATADIDEKLAAGDIDQARADELKADLTERVTEAVNRDGLGARGGPGGRHR